MNIETIAKLSGVSRSTVSRVINHSPNVRPEVRERVLEVLRETNFQPNAAARGLAAGATNIIGLVIPTGVSRLFSEPYFSLLIQGISAACSARGYTVMLWLSEPENKRRMMGQILHSGLIEGLVISSIHADDPLIEELLEQSIPFVVVGRMPEEKPIHYVDVDNVTSAEEAVSHLIERGRKKIACITGPEDVTVSVDRLRGYRQALDGAQLHWEPESVACGDFTQEGGYRAMQRLLPHQPDAVFAASDAMAQGAALAIRDAGLRVPDDVALVGFDDAPFAAHMQPPLTTVRQPIERLGQAAVELLIQLLRREVTEAPRRLLFPTELVIRESSGDKGSIAGYQ